CKGCTPECPSNVDLALLKAEMLHARWRRDGLPLRERIFSNVDLLGRIGCVMPALANPIFDFKPLRGLMEAALGISAKRSLPHYANERFDKWFEKHAVAGGGDPGQRTAADDRGYNDAHRAPLQQRGRVVLWDDTFVRYHEPHIGIAAVKVLEALGFEVTLAKNRQCCGRSAFSVGNLDAAAKAAKHNVDLLLSLRHSNTPIIFLEPSCWSMFVEDYRELKIENAQRIAKRCFLFEKFVDDLLAQQPDALQFDERSATVAIHPH